MEKTIRQKITLTPEQEMAKLTATNKRLTEKLHNLKKGHRQLLAANQLLKVRIMNMEIKVERMLRS